MKKLAVVLACAALAACAGPRRRGEVVVEAEGWGVLSGQSLASAKQRALAEAQKKAVETAVGVTVRARTTVTDALKIRQTITANLGGTLRGYKVLAERAEGEYYKVLIKARVLMRSEKPAAKKNAARVALRISDERVANAVRLALMAEDFDLVDDDKTADALVAGVVETYGRSDPALFGFHTERASVALTVADRRTSATTERTCQGTLADSDRLAAWEGAREAAGRACGLDVVQILLGEAGVADAGP